MFLVMKEDDWEDMVKFSIFEVEGELDCSGYFKCRRNPANRILALVHISGPNKLFDNLDDAKDYANKLKDEHIKTLLKKIEYCKVDTFKFRGLV